MKIDKLLKKLAKRTDGELAIMTMDLDRVRLRSTVPTLEVLDNLIQIAHEETGQHFIELGPEELALLIKVLNRKVLNTVEAAEINTIIATLTGIV